MWQVPEELAHPVLTLLTEMEREPQGVPSAPKAMPPWRLSHVRIQDFRPIRHVCVHLSKMTILVGGNNTGKSAVLQAVQYALGGGQPIRDDFHRGAEGVRAHRCVIDLRFEPWFGQKTFPRVVQNRFVNAPGLSLDPQYVSVRVEGVPTSDGTSVELKRALLDGWACERDAAEALPIISGKSITQLMWALQHAELLGPSRDLDEQTRQRRSHLGQAVADLRLSEKDAQKLTKRVNALADQITNASPALKDVQNEIKRISDDVDSSLEEIVVSVLPPDLDDLGHQLDVRIASHGGPVMPLRMQGHGARSLGAIAVFQALTAQRKAIDGGPVLPVTGLEEPEAHLHPQAHDAVLSFIAAIPGQTIISTHSPYVARGADLTDLRVLRCHEGTTSVTAVPDRDHNGNPPFDEQGLAKASRFVQSYAGETLFARFVVLIEGKTEAGAMPVLAEASLGRPPASVGVSLLSIDGTPGWANFVKPLHHLGVPWLLFLDGDLKGHNDPSAKFKAQLPTAVHDRLVFIPHQEDFEAMAVRACLDACRAHVKTVKPATALSDNADATVVLDELRKLKSNPNNGRLLAERLVKARAIPRPVTALFDRVRAHLNLDS